MILIRCDKQAVVIVMWHSSRSQKIVLYSLLCCVKEDPKVDLLLPQVKPTDLFSTSARRAKFKKS